MPVVNGSEQEECNWVVEKCKTHLANNDKSAAKAWILTARSLFPDNFDVQVWVVSRGKRLATRGVPVHCVMF